MTNGNGWTKWLAGLIWVVIFTAMTTLTTNMIANRNHQLRADERLSEKLHKTDIELRDCVDKKILQVKQDIKDSVIDIKEDITLMREEQRIIRTKQDVMVDTQGKVLAILERVEKKVD